MTTTNTAIENPAADPATGRLEPRLRALVLRQLRGLSGLRGRLMATSGGKQVQSILVTSGLVGEGKTTVSVILGVSLASALKMPVLLIDGNLHSPQLHRLFGLDPKPGLGEMAAAAASPEACVRATEFPNLMVMPAGDMGRLGANVFEGLGFAKVLDELRGRFHNVIMDGPAMLTSSEVLMVVPMFDGVIEVVMCEQTKMDVPVAVRERIESVGGVVLGAVLNRRRFYVPRFFYGKF